MGMWLPLTPHILQTGNFICSSNFYKCDLRWLSQNEVLMVLSYGGYDLLLS